MSNKKTFPILLLLAFVFQGFSQTVKKPSPYEWDWTRDGIWTGVALGGTAAGFLLIQNKDGFTESEIANFQSGGNDINFIDDWATGNYSESASTLSDIPFYTAFAIPFTLFFDDEMNDHAGQVMGMYIQSMATTSALFTVSAGLTNRARPYVYNTETPKDQVRKTSATRSFYWAMWHQPQRRLFLLPKSLAILIQTQNLNPIYGVRQ